MMLNRLDSKGGRDMGFARAWPADEDEDEDEDKDKDKDKDNVLRFVFKIHSIMTIVALAGS